jgi:hypothetical protein
MKSLLFRNRKVFSQPMVPDEHSLVGIYQAKSDVAGLDYLPHVRDRILTEF